MIVGVLGLQGAYAKHVEKLEHLECQSLVVKTPSQLDQCDRLILPGGESSTLLRLLERDPVFLQSLKIFVSKKPVWGSCAGLILLSKTVRNPDQESFGVIDIEVERNGYGRQRESFVTENIDVVSQKHQNILGEKVPGFFIRAPKIVKLGADVDPMMRFGGEVVAAISNNVCVSTFHPELTDSDYFHQWFCFSF